MSVADLAHIAVVSTIDGMAILANALTPSAMRSYAVLMLNNAIVDILASLSSALIVTRVVNLPDSRVAFVYLGPCAEIAGSTLCRLCESSLFYLVNQSTTILLISFGYRLYVIRSDSASAKTPSRTKILSIALLSHLVLAPLACLYYISLQDLEGRYSQYQSDFEGRTISMLHTHDIRFITFIIFAGSFSTLATGTIFMMRRSLLHKIYAMSDKTRAHHLNIAKALTCQMLLPIGVGMAVSFWLLDLFNIYPGQLPQRCVIVGIGFPPIASPIINMLFISPYRNFFSSSKISTVLFSKPPTTDENAV